MRIDAYMQVNQLYQTSKTKKTDASQRSAAKSSDTLELSSFGRELKVARQAVSDAPDVRMDRVEELKSAINSGSYDLSMDRLAEKLTDRYFS